MNKHQPPVRILQNLLLVTILSFCLFNCKSSQQSSTSSRQNSEMQELDEDVFFGESDGKPVESRPSRKPKVKAEVKEAKAEVKKVIKTARSYIGTPYRYGGTTRSGMDCSGLLCTSFRTVDIQLPRTSDAQSRFGKTVDLEELEEGDLVFFSERKGQKKISHVGMVTEVKGKDEVRFIHASSKVGVIEADLYAPYFIKIFVKAVRPF